MLYSTGMLYGQVVDKCTGEPIADATIALMDSKGKVVRWTTSNVQGDYALPVDCLKALDLDPRRRSVASSIERGFFEVVRFPVEAAGVAVNAAAATTVAIVRTIDPIGTVRAAVITAAEGSQLALGPVAAGEAAELASVHSERSVRGGAAAAVLVPQKKPRRINPYAAVPGEVTLMVGAGRYKQYLGKAGSYWIRPARPSDDERKSSADDAWLDSIELAPAKDVKLVSGEVDLAATLCDPDMNPPYAAAGSSVTISVKLDTPEGSCPHTDYKVIARVQSTHQVAELLADGNGKYTGTFALWPSTPIGQTSVTVAALDSEPLAAYRNRIKNADYTFPGVSLNWLLAYASHLDDLDAGKLYRFDPRVMASENRLDLQLQVLNPRLQAAALPNPPPPIPPARAQPTADSSTGSAKPDAGARFASAKPSLSTRPEAD